MFRGPQQYSCARAGCELSGHGGGERGFMLRGRGGEGAGVRLEEAARAVQRVVDLAVHLTHL